MSQSLLTGGGAGGVTGTLLVQEAKQINVAKIVSRINLAGIFRRAVPCCVCRVRSGAGLHKRTALEKRLPRGDVSVTSSAGCERFMLFLIFIFHRGWNGRIRHQHAESDGIGRSWIDDWRNCRSGKASSLRAAGIRI